AREFPAVSAALAEGRVHLSGLSLLAPHLTRQNADQLLTAATLKTKLEIEQVVAERFPSPDVPTRVRALAPALPTAPVPARLETSAPEQPHSAAPNADPSSVPGRIDPNTMTMEAATSQPI